MRRLLCLYLPRWPLQCLHQNRPETRGKPAALFERTAHGPRLTVCSVEACKLGIARGMTVADATALTGDLLLYENDRAAERAALERLALWAGRFSPLVGLESPASLEGEERAHPQALFLDITGCEQLFHGEENLVRLALKALVKKGFTARAAVAETLGAAWALAHYGPLSPAPSAREGAERDAHAAAAAIGALPLACLRLNTEPLVWLRKLGLRCVDDLLKQPRASLPSRFGPEIIQRLDQALGTAPEIFVPLRPAPEIQAARAFEYLLKDQQFLLAVIEQMLKGVVLELQRRCRGAREIECWFYHEIADPLLVTVNLFKSSASKKHLLQLLRTRLEDTRVFRPTRAKTDDGPQPEDGICAVALRVTATEALDAEQLALFSKRLRAPDSLAMTLDRISTRLGPGTVLRPELKPDPQPEHACSLKPFVEDIHQPDFQAPARPLQLLPEPLAVQLDWPEDRPQPLAFDCDGAHVGLCGASGPERIETGWWKTTSYARRDYYVVDSDAGIRYWLFRRLDDDQWFLHGVFS